MHEVVKKQALAVSEGLLSHTERFASLDARMNGGGQELTSPEKQQRRYSSKRVVKLEERWERVAKLLTTQEQREQYVGASGTGVNAWHEDFKLLREHTPDSTAEVLAVNGENFQKWRDRALRERGKIWEQLDESPYKRFVEIFSDPDLGYALPAFNYQRGNLQLQPGVSMDTLSLRGVLVDPGEIPDWMAERFFGASFESDAGGRVRPLERIEWKSDPAIVSGVKLVFESARPILPNNYRVQIVSVPPEHIAGRYSDAAPLQPDEYGSILYIRKKEQGVVHARTQKGAALPLPQSEVQCFSSVYAAYRKTCHQESGYDGELGDLARIQARLHRLTSTVDREWRKGISEKRKAELLDQTITIRDEVQDNLKHCTNRYKVRANDLVTAVAGMHDSLGRENPGPTLMRLTATTRRVQQRVSELPDKEGYNQRDRRALLMEIKLGEELIKEFRDSIVSGAEVLSREGFVLGSRAISDRQLESGVKGIINTIGAHPDGLSLIRARPSLTFAQRLQAKGGELEDALMERDRDAAQDRLLEMHLIGKVHAACVCFEHINERLIRGEQVALESLHTSVEKLDRLFKAREIFQERELPACRDSFELLGEGIAVILKRLEHYRNQNLDAEGRTEMYTNLKRHLKSFDFEKLVKNLS